MLRFAVLAMFLHIVWGGQVLGSDHIVSVATIVESGGSFHMRSVVIQGTVTSVINGLPTHYYDGSLCGQNDSYAFLLEDSSGRIDVMVHGTCGSPYRAIQVKTGDQVSVQGTVYAYCSTDSTGFVAVQVFAYHIQGIAVR